MITVQSETGPLRRVLVRRPADAFGSQARIDSAWQRLGYLGAPDLAAAVAEHDAFVEILTDSGTEVVYLEGEESLGLDSLYTRDASFVCSDGAILCRMGKDGRVAEPEAHGRLYEKLGVRVLGAIRPPGTVEGGDLAWLDPSTLVAGLGYRTNAEGIRQLRELLGTRIDELIVVPLPHWRGPADVFHLMSMFSPLAGRAILVYSPLMPVPFRQTLIERGFTLVDVPDEEFESMGCNVLALEPGRCLMLEGNPRTRDRIERAGLAVIEYRGGEISTRGSGGPTCLTRPLSRAAFESESTESEE